MNLKFLWSSRVCAKSSIFNLFLPIPNSASNYDSDFSHSDTSSVFEIRSKKLSTQIKNARKNFKLNKGSETVEYLKCSRRGRSILVNKLIKKLDNFSLSQNFENCVNRISKRIKHNALVIVFSRNKENLNSLHQEILNKIPDVTVINGIKSCELEFDESDKKIILTSQLSIIENLNSGMFRNGLISFIHLKDKNRNPSYLLKKCIDQVEYSKFIIPKSIYLYFDTLRIADPNQCFKLMVKSLFVLKRRLTVSSRLEIDDINAALNSL